MSVAWGQSYSYRCWLDNDVSMVKTGTTTGHTQFTVNPGTLPVGLHALRMQVQDADGVWSSVQSRFFINVREQKQATTARYWFDDDVETMHNDVSTRGTIDVDVSGLTFGLHTIHYQTMSSDGTFSSARTGYVYVDQLHWGILTAAISIDGKTSTNYSPNADGDIVIDISDLEDGDHTLRVVLTDDHGIVQGTKNVTFNVSSVIAGDVNADGSVDIGDIVMVISVMTGAETDAAIVVRADVNGDGAADIGDIVSIIGIMTGQPAGARAYAAARIWQQENSDRVSMTMEDNILHLSLDNARDYTAFQFQLSLPEGTSPDDVTISSLRGQGHVATVEPMGNGQYLVMGYSLGNKTFNSFSGELLTLNLKGQQTGQAAIDNVVFADTKGHTYRLMGSEATGIDGIENGKTRMDNSVYDLQGRKVTIGKNGIYLIGNKKVVIK